VINTNLGDTVLIKIYQSCSIFIFQYCVLFDYPDEVDAQK